MNDSLLALTTVRTGRVSSRRGVGQAQHARVLEKLSLDSRLRGNDDHLRFRLPTTTA